MGSIVKDIQVIPHQTIANEFGVRTTFECCDCYSIFHVDNFDKEECQIFFSKIKNKELLLEAVCKNCHYIINVN